MSKPENPRAFPSTGKEEPEFRGMTLLDYFAGKVAPAIYKQFAEKAGEEGREIENKVESEMIADVSYEIAKAMLKERQKHI